MLLFGWPFAEIKAKKAPEPISIKFLPKPEPKKPEPPRVAPEPENKPTKEPVETRNRAESDRLSPIESIKRGLELPKPEEIKPPAKEQAQTPSPNQEAKMKASKQASTKSTTGKTKRAEPPAPEIEFKFPELNSLASIPKSPGSSSQNDTKPSPEKVREQAFRSKTPFRRNLGTSIQLNNIPDGEVTLLNTKADQNAVFVRRVALQVFGGLRKRHWAQMSASQIRRITSPAEIKAIMSPEGKLLSTEVLKSSGSSYFDKLALEAVKEGAWDRNPPPKAYHRDGNIHFSFLTKTWTRFVGEAGREERWLRLGTKLF